MIANEIRPKDSAKCNLKHQLIEREILFSDHAQTILIRKMCAN